MTGAVDKVKGWQWRGCGRLETGDNFAISVITRLVRVIHLAQTRRAVLDCPDKPGNDGAVYSG